MVLEPRRAKVTDSAAFDHAGAAYEGPFSMNQMHGAGAFTDKQGVAWKGKFYNGSGPGLPGGATVLAA